MKLLIYADIHCTEGSEQCHVDPTLSLRIYQTKKFFNDLQTVHNQYGCEGIIDLGDTTSDRSSLPIPVIDTICSCVAGLPSSKWNFKLIGNHEQFLRDTSVNNKRLFDRKFTVIDQNAVYTVNDTALVFCSYPEKNETLAQWIHEQSHVLHQNPKILFGHFQVSGCLTASGASLSGIPRSSLSAFNLCLLGHIHFPQSLSKTIHYVGSPFQQDWSEAGQQKRVAIVDTDTFNVTWVLLTGYPEYRRIDFADFQKLESVSLEHRFRVVLSTHEETEQYFQHHLFHLTEAEYAYDAAVPKEQQQERDWSFEGTCLRYMSLVPPATIGINLTAEDMLGIGQGIARGDYAQSS